MKSILLLALSVIILSQGFGLAYAVHVSGHVEVSDEGVAESNPIVTVSTNSASYETGEVINVEGRVSDYNESDPFKNFDITLRVIDPKNNIINISQLSLDGGGYYYTAITAEGPLWKFDGDYTISVSHGSDRQASTTFTFVISTTIAEAEAAEAEAAAEEAAAAAEAAAAEAAAAEAIAAEKCGQGTHLEDGVCVLDETAETTSTPSTTGSSPSTGFNAWVYSISFTILIAFAIMIILYLISRASKNKNDN